MVFAVSQGGVENELESYLDSRTVGSGAGGDFCVPAGYGNNAENSVACLRGSHRNAAGERINRKMNEFLFSGLFVHLIFVKDLKCNKRKTL